MAVPDGMWPEPGFMGLLDAGRRRELLALGSRRSFPPGAALVLEGSTDSTVFVLVDGWVKVLGSSADGGTSLLAVRGRGDLIGELAAIDSRPRSATVIAARTTAATEVTAVAFRGFLRAHPGSAEALQRTVAGKLRSATRYRIDAGGGSATVRLARTLDTLVRTHGLAVDGGLRIDMPLSQSDLASLTGISDASAQRALRRLRLDGTIITGYRGIEVRRPAALRAVAEQRAQP
ncbi:Crp/Fnr family transcriptional regulator [Streptomyces sp. NPDC048290]|uniref:Crp/Fnr family transcriptional regulator n=1 Tax=Streptomyces sp. NPDC048290 TaxID=3155811 RepID=UPI00343DE651